MLQRIQSAAGTYPRQFWLLFWGLLISTTGASMIWPFLMIYVSGKLKLPLTSVASLMTVNALVGLVFTFVGGSITDRFGRKWVLAVSLAGNGIGYLLMSRASTLGEFAVLMGMSGLFQPLYRVGADSMLADLIPMDRRADAYSILRMSNNIGVSLGPAIGGFIASASYTTAFFFASAGMLIYSLLVAFRARETIPVKRGLRPGDKESGSGYGRVFGDRPYMAFILTLTLVQSASALVWVLLGVYAKQNYGVAENQYGLIPTTNALMVVFLQVLVTAVTKRRPPLLMMAAGSLFYAVGVGSVAFGTGFWGFWISMIVITCGELVLMPTSSTYAANLAPPEMRGRYLSLYGLTWSLASGIGPILGGYLNDQIAPQAIWYGGFVLGLASALGFILLSRRNPALGSAGAANPPNPD